MNIIQLATTKSRVGFRCQIKGLSLIAWIDTGAPNTLIHPSVAEKLRLLPADKWRFTGAIAGAKFIDKPSVVLPSIVVGNGYALQNVRAITAFEDDKWKNIIIIGLNVLNHLTYKIDRSPLPGTFEWLESLTSGVPGSDRTRFDHIMWNGEYLLEEANNITME